MNFRTLTYLAAGSIILLTGCQQPGADLQADVYSADQVNQQQHVKVVRILAIMPARIAVSNQQAKQGAELVGGVLGALGGGIIGNNICGHYAGNTIGGGAVGGAAGALAGSMVSDTTLVNGVSLTYSEDGQTLSSAQVGQLCQFTLGKAIVVSTTANETRIQPNATCPPPKTGS